MAPQATLTAEHVLRAGGNAFDAIVAGQAVLGVVQPNLNGIGSDATLLIYDARNKKVCFPQRRRHRAQAGDHRVVSKHQGRQNPGERFAAFGNGPRRGGRVVHSALALGHQDVRATA